jgi:hypothetical protein
MSDGVRGDARRGENTVIDKSSREENTRIREFIRYTARKKPGSFFRRFSLSAIFRRVCRGISWKPDRIDTVEGYSCGSPDPDRINTAIRYACEVPNMDRINT